jgi:hypothetical protein
MEEGATNGSGGWNGGGSGNLEYNYSRMEMTDLARILRNTYRTCGAIYNNGNDVAYAG